MEIDKLTVTASTKLTDWFSGVIRAIFTNLNIMSVSMLHLLATFKENMSIGINHLFDWEFFR